MLKQIISNFKKVTKENNSYLLFQKFKPLMINYIKNHIPSYKLGRPQTVSLESILDAIFQISNDGSKIRTVIKTYKLSKTSFLRYLKVIGECNIFENLHNQLCNEYKNKICDNVEFIDSFYVKSMRGSECVGPNSTDRGRNGCKVFLRTYKGGQIKKSYIGKANPHDSKIFQEVLNKEVNNKRKTFVGDSAFVGKNIKQGCKSKNSRMVASPKKTRSKKLSHYVQTRDRPLLRQRWCIERAIGHLRNFRGTHIKHFIKINSYKVILDLAIFLTTSLQLYNLE